MSFCIKTEEKMCIIKNIMSSLVTHVWVFLSPTDLKNKSTTLNITTTNWIWQKKQWIFIVWQQALKCSLHNAILSDCTLTMTNITRKCNAIKASPRPLSPMAMCGAPPPARKYSGNIKYWASHQIFFKAKLMHNSLEQITTGHLVSNTMPFRSR